MSGADAFDALVSGLDYPMYIVTAQAPDGGRSGCLVGFATQASIVPPRLLVLISKLNHTWPVAERSNALAVHFLHRDNHDLADLFGEQTGDDVDKFSRCAWHDGPDGTIVLSGTRGWVVGRVLARWDAGDHVAHLIDVAHAAVDHDGSQLDYQLVRHLDPGHPA
jgi:flavin reductase (DIM6/NTAB) family NADH-FMN oxidoreductase RutF